jgi:hypothetical protein
MSFSLLTLSANDSTLALNGSSVWFPFVNEMSLLRLLLLWETPNISGSVEGSNGVSL